MTLSMATVALALVAIAGGEPSRAATDQSLAFGLVLAVCVGQSVMMLLTGPRRAVR